MKHMMILASLLISSLAFSATDEEVKAAVKSNKVKYKESGRIDFESLLIEGERKKPELSVVTGNVGEKDNGLMVIRKDFKDMMANDFGEIIE
ncbi:MAG: hypothetical protein COW00_07620 [Bdellovibrio sp. CG12_big_fil_rev_8_21_14_0_65_39_13]|nr:MAG: hypothetical protein COW78_12300 [Bdellovibrio sp. CG22_combo_CG10-13_8_21_14_all_39_27]PIQ60124.1 MAG: hypothetical protein COW00_07620 [Bdellovibrio sp. CG12_big_fil_rev_8_21_14_0_65_39_13]PIR36759.1 MAG: hypothetical protein COV37_01120 [Bdellovibrio sp. CG11_big_fil_rev_8_21_14_0_20_39_38]PJB53809.1 MAG: hypothetical protein CO099_05180 [Bdellovibrio sp. CG_4_9_14_3_um_filter_39_7]